VVPMPCAGGGARRVVILYGGKIFACRHCHQLAYESTREKPDDRASRKADRIRKKLGWEAGILNPNGIKPKGLHWKTFHTLQLKHDVLVNQSLAGIVKRLRLFDDEPANLKSSEICFAKTIAARSSD